MAAAIICMVKVLLLCPPPLVALTLKFVAPATVVGVPVIVPLAFRVKPGGIVPIFNVHPEGVPPVAVGVKVTATPTVNIFGVE